MPARRVCLRIRSLFIRSAPIYSRQEARLCPAGPPCETGDGRSERSERSHNRLKKSVERPDITGPQPLKPDAHPDLLAGTLADDPANIAADLDRLGLRWQLKPKLNGGANWNREGRLDVETAQREVTRTRHLFFSIEEHLDLQL